MILSALYLDLHPAGEGEDDDLVAYLKTINSDLADVVTLGFQGFDKKDVVKQLPVKSSQAYDLYAKAEKLTREFLFK